jgi:guanylate kinase
MKYILSRKRLLFVISAPSGGGKSTVLDRLLDKDSMLKYSVSATSRAPRPGEVDGVHYDFLTSEQFQDKKDKGEFLEHAIVHDHHYGTLRSRVDELINSGYDVIMDLDFQGGLNVKHLYENCFLIFIMPPSVEVLEQRLLARGKDSRSTIDVRLKNAQMECDHAVEYDYVVLNDVLDNTVETVSHIINAVRYKAENIRIEKINDAV